MALVRVTIELQDEDVEEAIREAIDRGHILSDLSIDSIDSIDV